MKEFLKKYGSTLFLRIAIIVAGIAAIVVCGIATWWVISDWKAAPEYHTIMIVLVIGLFCASVPFVFALFQAIRLLGYIDTNRAFSELSVKALKNIMISAIVIFIICTVGGLPFFYFWAELEDAPGLIVIGIIIAGVAFVIAIFASLLSRLLKEAIEAKAENELTV